jgi:PKD repeat protein
MRKSHRIMALYLIGILSSIVVSSLGSASITVVFSPTNDTMINQNEYPNTAFGDVSNMAVRNGYGSNGRNYYEINSLIKFDVFSIPSTATILSASLHLYYYNWSGTDPAGRVLLLYLITSGWNEKTVHWNFQPSCAATSSSSAVVPASKGHWMIWDVSTDVQHFVTERAYYGWKIADETAWRQPDIPMVYFRTKDYGNYIPFLEVTYMVSEGNTQPTAGFSLTPLNPTTADSIQFTDTSYDPDGTITGWYWSFGDGNSSTSRAPTHAYNTSGVYTVTLQVTDDKGATDTMSMPLSVSVKKSSPGFEFVIVGSAIALALFLTRKSKKK